MVLHPWIRSLGSSGADWRRRGESLTASVARLPALGILDQLPVPILGVHVDRSIAFAHNAFTEMLGYQIEDLLEFRSDEIFVSSLMKELARIRLREGAGRAMLSFAWRGSRACSWVCYQTAPPP